MASPAPLPPRPGLAGRLWFVWSLVWAGLMVGTVALAYVLTRPFDPTPAHYRRWTRRWSRATLWGAGVRVRSEGGAALDPDQPYLFVANHQNSFDIPVLYLALAHTFGFVAKAELRQLPILGRAIRGSLCVFLDRSHPRKSLESLQAAGERIRGGVSVLVFPEGQRSYGPTLAAFKRGAFLLAAEAGVPLVPVTVVDGYRVLDEPRRAARPGVVHVVVGEPIPVPPGGRRALPALIDDVRAAVARPLPAGAEGASEAVRVPEPA